jgi:hypothetical protein
MGFLAVRRIAKRAVPLALEAYRRWDRLPAHKKERYKQSAKRYAERGRDIARRGGRR